MPDDLTPAADADHLSGQPTRDWSPVMEQVQRRLALVEIGPAAAGTDMVRLFHGRGRTYPGFHDVTVDLLGSVILIGLFAEDDPAAVTFARTLGERVPEGVAAIIVQHRRGRQTEAKVAWGALPETVVGREAGLSYVLHPTRNQNVGVFLDAAPLRTWVRDNARDANVLNLFAYTCGFSLAAIAGGARQVVNNDMSRAALDWGRANHKLNGDDPRAVKYVPHNLFKSWWKLKQFARYDLIIFDPPTNQRGSFNAEKDYATMLKKLPDLAAPGAKIAACLNSPFLDYSFLESQIRRWAPKARIEGKLVNSVDFPEAQPERALKVLYCEWPR